MSSVKCWMWTVALTWLGTQTGSSVLAEVDPATRWEESIAKFEKADAATPPGHGRILFVGSSSIRIWDTDRWFPSRGVLNRGFGGSQVSDVNYFAHRIVLKYRPRVIVFYAGDNDINKGKSAERVTKDFQLFGQLIRERLPECHLIYIPIKPSLARWKLWSEMSRANAAIREYLARCDRFHYADIVTPALDEDGRPRPEIFKDDGLHLNDEGYAIWTSVVTRLLDQIDESADEPPSVQ